MKTTIAVAIFFVMYLLFYEKPMTIEEIHAERDRLKSDKELIWACKERHSQYGFRANLSRIEPMEGNTGSSYDQFFVVLNNTGFGEKGGRHCILDKTGTILKINY